MAWLDDRVWCHPKITDLTDAAYRAYVNGIAYSSGFDTSGYLTDGQQRAIGSTDKTRAELIAASLWDDVDGDTVRVHNWEEHNEKRDARRRADRARKREERAKSSTRQSTGTSRGASAGQSRGRSAGQGADKTSDRRTLTGDGVTGEEAAAANGSLHDAAAALRLRLEELDLATWLVDQALTLDPAFVTAWLDLADTEADANPAGFIRRGLDSGEWPSARARKPDRVVVDPVDRRRRFVEGDGRLLPADELEFQLREMGADGDELEELTDLAADLRGVPGG